MTPQETLARYISQELLMEPNGTAITADEDLLTSGLIDSLGIMRLISFIEDEFEVEVYPEDVTLENFCTVNIIADYLDKRFKTNPKVE